MNDGVLPELIERNIGQLVHGWTQAVRADPRSESDSNLTTPELIDHVPAIVAEICALMRGGETPCVTNTHEARANVYTRVRQGYTGRDLVRELSFLRIALINFVMEAAAREQLGITRADWQDAMRLLNLYLDEEMHYAVTVFCGPRTLARPASLPGERPTTT